MAPMPADVVAHNLRDARKVSGIRARSSEVVHIAEVVRIAEYAPHTSTDATRSRMAPMPADVVAHNLRDARKVSGIRTRSAEVVHIAEAAHR